MKAESRRALSKEKGRRTKVKGHESRDKNVKSQRSRVMSVKEGKNKAVIKSFEDLEVWQRLHRLVIRIYEITAKFPQGEDYNLKLQLRRSICSAKANIAEGFGRYYYNDSKKFYRNSRGSLLESKDHLLTARDVPNPYISKELYKDLAYEIEISKRLVNGLIGSTGSLTRDQAEGRHDS